ncbi:MAG: peptide chain release factor-like protein [Candidatus Nealsonbacteria bacterium]
MEKDLKKEVKIFYSTARGPGGQRRDRKKTGVRLLHLPSGITIRYDGTRSQAQNKKRAFELLQVKLWRLSRPKKRRIPTQVPRRAKKKRLRRKKIHSEKKRLRRIALTEE